MHKKKLILVQNQLRCVIMKCCQRIVIPAPMAITGFVAILYSACTLIISNINRAPTVKRDLLLPFTSNPGIVNCCPSSALYPVKSLSVRVNFPLGISRTVSV